VSCVETVVVVGFVVEATAVVSGISGAEAVVGGANVVVVAALPGVAVDVAPVVPAGAQDATPNQTATTAAHHRRLASRSVLTS
jgi:hypothetical protein